MKGEKLTPYLFILPFTVIFVVFIGFPFLYALYLSFHRVVDLSNVFGGLQFVGLKNYTSLLGGFDFWWSFGLTLIYALLLIPSNIILALILASALSKDSPINRLYRTLFFLPFVLDVFVVGVVWTLIYTTPYGVLPQLLEKIGIGVPAGGFLGNPYLALPSIAFAIVLKNIGFGIVLFTAAFGNIPREVYEAAELDGATGWKKTYYITLPLVKPIIAFLTVVGFMGALSGFAEVYAMTGGGPTVRVAGHIAKATKITGYLLFEKLQMLKLGPASALSFILLIFALFFSMLSLKLLKRAD